MAFNKVIRKVKSSMAFNGVPNSRYHVIMLLKHQTNMTNVVKLPIRSNIFTINRSPHGNKTARDQFKLRGSVHRVVFILDSEHDLMEGLKGLENIGIKQGITPINTNLLVTYTNNYKLSE